MRLFTNINPYCLLRAGDNARTALGTFPHVGRYRYIIFVKLENTRWTNFNT